MSYWESRVLAPQRKVHWGTSELSPPPGRERLTSKIKEGDEIKTCGPCGLPTLLSSSLWPVVTVRSSCPHRRGRSLWRPCVSQATAPGSHSSCCGCLVATIRIASIRSSSRGCSREAVTPGNSCFQDLTLTRTLRRLALVWSRCLSLAAGQLGVIFPLGGRHWLVHLRKSLPLSQFWIPLA